MITDRSEAATRWPIARVISPLLGDRWRGPDGARYKAHRDGRGGLRNPSMVRAGTQVLTPIAPPRAARAMTDFPSHPHRANVGPEEDVVTDSPREDPTLTFDDLVTDYLEDYELHGYRAINSAKSRVAQLRRAFGALPAVAITGGAVRRYQLTRRRQGAATGTINRETSALRRMFRLALRSGKRHEMPTFPERLTENPPRQGFFEHEEYLRVRQYLPAPYQDILDFAYYSGWRRREITELTWDEIGRAHV